MKRIPPGSRVYSNNAVQYCKKRLAELQVQGVPVVFVDEGVVTTKTMAKFEYAPKYQNFEVSEKDLNLKCLGFVVGLS